MKFLKAFVDDCASQIFHQIEGAKNSWNRSGFHYIYEKCFWYCGSFLIRNRHKLWPFRKIVHCHHQLSISRKSQGKWPKLSTAIFFESLPVMYCPNFPLVSEFGLFLDKIRTWIMSFTPFFYVLGIIYRMESFLDYIQCSVDTITFSLAAVVEFLKYILNTYCWKLGLSIFEWFHIEKRAIGANLICLILLRNFLPFQSRSIL